MPVEQATYISDLQPDWPDGKDKESEGDDHLRMLKQTIQNTWPNTDAPITGTPTQQNNLTSGMQYTPADADAGTPATWSLTDPADSTTLRPVNLGDGTGEHAAVTLGMIYRVGAKFESATDSRNPAEILGFGTWEPITGFIAGAGDATDTNGLTISMTAGRNPGAWRVQNGHIVQFTASGQTETAGNHQHDYQYAVYDDSGDDDQDGAANNQTMVQGLTGWAGDHAHPFSVAIGEGDLSSGTAFFNPYYGMYIWVRTA